MRILIHTQAKDVTLDWPTDARVPVVGEWIVIDEDEVCGVTNVNWLYSEGEDLEVRLVCK